ncbi:thioredoxin-like domain-containing protein [uncultured Kordia sp.]|uniref:thioredoxin-like domain-containing protein n=1 Tax=uncultured Kordia sp. TaxID=507699 RepID=UPI0026388356|nr:thioredoxin-like domain-containing protein [uncultured Kordia sp.]
MKYITPLLLILVCFGCSKPKKESNKNVAYFGGEIINPSDEYVLLYHKDKLVDSLKLDEDNRFLVKLKDHENGLYKFYHNPEHQYINIEKGDSILLRLNTLAFDESLFYTGKGAEKNNFYTDLYLVQQQYRDNNLYKDCKLDPASFEKRIDSVYKDRIQRTKEFFSQNPTISADFKDFINNVVTYTKYRCKETYENTINERVNDSIIIPKDFFNYRKNVNLNDSTLNYYVPYIRYAMQYINNESYSECIKKSLKENSKINTSLIYNKNKLKMIDSLVTLPNVRDKLLRYTAYSYFRNNHTDIDKNNDFFKMFQVISHNSESKKEISNLHKGIKDLQKGSFFSDKIHVQDTKYNKIPVNTLNSKKGKTVFYFWTSRQTGHKKLVTRKIKVLAEDFPELNIVGISLDTDHKRWKRALRELEFPVSQQYRVVNEESLSRDFALISINKLIITDQSGRILDAFSNVYNTDLRDQLKK